jgi:hypothetical protein
VEEESDDKEAELSCMDFVGVAIGQINSEPENLDLPLSSPLFRREEEKIKKIRPDNSTWYPFLNKEVSRYNTFSIKTKKLTNCLDFSILLVHSWSDTYTNLSHTTCII